MAYLESGVVRIYNGPSFINGDPHKSVYVALVVRKRVLLDPVSDARAMLCIELARAS